MIEAKEWTLWYFNVFHWLAVQPKDPSEPVRQSSQSSNFGPSMASPQGFWVELFQTRFLEVVSGQGATKRTVKTKMNWLSYPLSVRLQQKVVYE